VEGTASDVILAPACQRTKPVKAPDVHFADPQMPRQPANNQDSSVHDQVYRDMEHGHYEHPQPAGRNPILVFYFGRVAVRLASIRR